jgi:hypothetical protein
MRKRINHNNLLPWFTDDHGTLPKAYLKSCQKFFKEISASSDKPTSSKRQAAAETNKK